MTSSSSSSGIYNFTFDRYHTINEPFNMGNDHFILMYSGKIGSKTKSNVVFYGDSGTGDMSFDHYVAVLINGTKYYTPVYAGSSTVGCCSILTGETVGFNSSSSSSQAVITFAGWALIDVNGTESLWLPLYNLSSY